MKILNNAPLLASIWIAAMIVPLVIRGTIANYSLEYYQNVLFIYIFIVGVSTIGILISVSRNRKDRPTYITDEYMTPHSLLTGWLFSNALMTVGLWILGFATGTV